MITEHFSMKTKITSPKTKKPIFVLSDQITWSVPQESPKELKEQVKKNLDCVAKSPPSASESPPVGVPHVMRCTFPDSGHLL